MGSLIPGVEHFDRDTGWLRLYPTQKLFIWPIETAHTIIGTENEPEHFSAKIYKGVSFWSKMGEAQQHPLTEDRFLSLKLFEILPLSTSLVLQSTAQTRVCSLLVHVQDTDKRLIRELILSWICDQQGLILQVWKPEKLTWRKIMGEGRKWQSFHVFLQEILLYDVILVSRCVIVATFDSTHIYVHVFGKLICRNCSLQKESL